MDAQARLSTKQRFRIAKARAQRTLARGYPEFNPNQPRDESGRFGSGGSGTTSSEKPKGGKPKKKATKDDFKKAKIEFGDVSSEDDFVAIWNDKIGEDPATFKAEFMGGLDGTLKLGGSAQQIDINGSIEGSAGDQLGTFTRYINLQDKAATSAYFSLRKEATQSDVGKKLLAGNVETYERLGIEKIKVSANIDVGGYAWAKYGYVPTQAAWDYLRDDLERKLTGRGEPSSYRRERGPNEIEADDWSMLDSDTQDNVRDKWMRESHDEFLASEESNWRDGGDALDQAKTELAEDRDFVVDAIKEHLEPKEVDYGQKEPPEPTKFPYTAEQLAAAISIEYETGNEGRGDVTVDFDDTLLREPIGHEGGKDQMTLPGIEPEDLSQRLTEKMREELTEMLIGKFEDKASDMQYRLEAPDYLAESVTEYQSEYWDQLEDSQKLEYAVQYDMATIEIESEEEEEEEEEERELPLEPPKDELLELVRSDNPKSIWKIADSPRGKELLLGKNWAGVLNLKDAESMARFKAYVGRQRHA